MSSPVIFTGSGTLHAIVINDDNSAGTVTITDASSPSVNVGVINLASTAFTGNLYLYDCVISAGLQITTTASPNITVLYAKG